MIITVNSNITRVVDGLVKNNGPTRLSYGQLSNAAHGRSANLDVGPIRQGVFEDSIVEANATDFRGQGQKSPGHGQDQ